VWANHILQNVLEMDLKNYSLPISVGLIAILKQVEQWTKFLKVESSNIVYL
jgi:hypothetical protein